MIHQYSFPMIKLFYISSLAQLVWTMHNIYKVWQWRSQTKMFGVTVIPPSK